MTMDMVIKKLSECRIDEALDAWNGGFSDYYSPIKMTSLQFIGRMGTLSLSPDHSYVAFQNDIPAGIVLNGLSTIKGKTHAWNGGTSVKPDFRSFGVGRELIKKSLEMYEAEGADRVTLEAFAVNERAIRLYERLGYRYADTLLFLENKKALKENPFGSVSGYTVEKGSVNEAVSLPFYNPDVPWQTHGPFIASGLALIAFDQKGIPAAYALLQKKYGEEGDLSDVILFHCQARDNEQEPVIALLNSAFPAGKVYRQSTFNLPASSPAAKLLEKAGFTEGISSGGTPLKQVFMIKDK